MKSHKKRRYLKHDAISAHFRFLGLKRGECRVHVIRSAAHAKSIALTHQASHTPAPVADEHRAKIAVAAYRLLDPRERNVLYERIQLVYPVDREEVEKPCIDGQYLNESNSSLSNAIPLGTDHSENVIVTLMDQPLIDQAIDEYIPTGDSDLTLDERRSIVSLLRKSDESTLRSLSPLGWLRSRLGI